MSTSLRERTINTRRIGHYSERTIHTYIGWLIRLEKGEKGSKKGQ